MTRESSVPILLVEDDEGYAELTLMSLREAGLGNGVHHAVDGAEALDFIFGAAPGGPIVHRPGLILLDLKLPKVDGLQVLAKLKGDPRTSSIPVVVMTSSEQDRDVQEAFRLGVISYVVKPVDFNRFTEMVSGLNMYWSLANHVAN